MPGMYYNEKIETMADAEKEKLQLQRLEETVKICYEQVPFYRNKMDKIGIKPKDIKKLSDIQKLPFTTKEDLRDNYPFNLFAEKPVEFEKRGDENTHNKVTRIHASSGTTGKPTVVGYTREDIGLWAEVVARSLVCAGATPNSVIHNAYGYGLFTGGLGIHYGGEKLGATVIPMSGGNTERQIMLMEDFGADIITCTPSYALYIAEVMEDKNIDIKKRMKLRNGIFGAEPWTEEMRKKIEQRLNIKAYDIYGLSEIIGPGVSCECEAQKGAHIFDDHFYAEIIDPVTTEVLHYGKEGEIVFTSLTKRAFPILRYRTRDRSVLDNTKCECGRTHIRMKRITGRTDDMIIIRGVNIFPSQVESVLIQLDMEPNYQLVLYKDGELDALEIKAEIKEDEYKNVNKRMAITKEFSRALENTLKLHAKVTLIPPKSIARSEGKAVRIVDNRDPESEYMIEQLSVSLNTKKQNIATLLSALESVNIRALSVVNFTDYAVARIVVHNTQEAMAKLDAADFDYELVDVVALELDDKSGSLNTILSYFEEDKINVEYMYAFGGYTDGKSVMIFKFNNVKKALSSLRRRSIKPVKKDALCGDIGSFDAKFDEGIYSVRQITALISNKPGMLAVLTKMLAEAGINMHALLLSEAGDYGIVRIIADETEKAIKALEGKYMYDVTNVIVTPLEDKPGSLSEKLAVTKNSIVEYIYIFAHKDGMAYAIIQARDLDFGVVSANIKTEEEFNKIF